MEHEEQRQQIIADCMRDALRFQLNKLDETIGTGKSLREINDVRRKIERYLSAASEFIDVSASQKSYLDLCGRLDIEIKGARA